MRRCKPRNATGSVVPLTILSRIGFDFYVDGWKGQWAPSFALTFSYPLPVALLSSLAASHIAHPPVSVYPGSPLPFSPSSSIKEESHSRSLRVSLSLCLSLLELTPRGPNSAAHSLATPGSLYSFSEEDATTTTSAVPSVLRRPFYDLQSLLSGVSSKCGEHVRRRGKGSKEKAAFLNTQSSVCVCVGTGFRV